MKQSETFWVYLAAMGMALLVLSGAFIVGGWAGFGWALICMGSLGFAAIYVYLMARL